MSIHEARELVRLCATGRDEGVWKEFHDRFDCRLWVGVRRALARYDARLCEDDCQDLLQEVYCRLLEKGGRILRRCRGNGEGSVSAYLSRVAESVVVDHLRAINAAKRGRKQLMSPSLESGLALADIAADPGSTPEERLLRRERKEAFMIRCREMVGKHRQSRDLQVLYLAFFEGWTSREICHHVGEGLTVSAVDSVVHRLKKRLSQQNIEIPRRRPGVAEDRRESPAPIDQAAEPLG